MIQSKFDNIQISLDELERELGIKTGIECKIEEKILNGIKGYKLSVKVNDKKHTILELYSEKQPFRNFLIALMVNDLNNKIEELKKTHNKSWWSR